MGRVERAAGEGGGLGEPVARRLQLAVDAGRVQYGAPAFRAAARAVGADVVGAVALANAAADVAADAAAPRRIDT